MRTVFTSLTLLAVLGAALVLFPGCPGDETVNNTYQLPGFVRITTDYLPDVQEGTAYSQTITAIGGSSTFTWSIEAGGTNDGWLSIDAAGALTGTPATANVGLVVISIRVDDTDDATKWDTERYVFYVTAIPAPPPPAFPGTDVADNNHAMDGLAFSPSTVDVDLTTGPKMFLYCNHGNGTGIFLTKMTDDAQTPARFSLWASYFDGTDMTPMVELRGAQMDTDGDFDFDHCKVVFINISGDARDGDAIILFARSELNTGSDVRLYSAYFDVSDVANAVSASNAAVHYGFDTVGDLVDTAVTGDDVKSVGIITDGLFLLAPRFSDSFTFYLQGNPVTYVGAIWTKGDGSSTGLYSAAFDLSATNTSNTFSTQVAQVPATRSLDGDDNVDMSFTVTGDCVVYRVEYNTEGGGDDDEPIEAAAYNAATGGFDNTAALTRVDPTDDVDTSSSWGALGSIQGLARVYVLSRESGYDESSAHPDTDVVLHIYNPADGSVSTAEIDYHTANSTGVDVPTIGMEINRTGEIIWVNWLQRDQEVASTATADCLFMQAIQTIRTGGTSRSLANSILAAPVLMNSDTTSDNGVNYADVIDRAFDDEVMYYFGNQSDYLRCNTIFIQEADNPSDSNNLCLHSAYLKITLDTTGTAPPTADAGSGTASDTIIWENDNTFPFWVPGSIKMETFRVHDGGTNGEPVVYFIADGDGTPWVHTGSSEEPRLFCWDGRTGTVTTTTEISGDCTDCGENTLGFSNSRQVVNPGGGQGDGAFAVTSMPWQPYTGANANVSASYHSIMFREERDVPGSTTMLRHRCFDLNSTEPAAADMFFPALTSQPFDVSRDAPEHVVAFLGSGPGAQNNTTTAIYFKQGTHLYYNEYQPGSTNTWSTFNGLSHPMVVDDDDYTNDAVLTWSVMAIAPFTIGSFDSLANYPTFYVKAVNLGGSNPLGGPMTRIFCRFHD